MWPRTNRVLPWLVAVFLVMIWLVPFDSIQAPFRVGVDSKLDRVLLVIVITVWLIVAAAGGRYAPRFRRTPLNLALLFFGFVALVSVASSLTVLTNLGDLKLAIKQLALLFAYLGFFYVVVTVVRPEEVRPFLRFMVFLACVTALGTIVEYRTRHNYFYSLATSIFHGFSVSPPPRGNKFARAQILGPTQTSLADAAILSMALSFALVFLFHARERRAKIMWWLAAGILLAGTISTQRKSSLLIPVGTVVAMAVYSPKRMIKFLPAIAALGLVATVVSPHAVSGVLYQFKVVSTSNSTTHRTEAYPFVTPYILAHPFFGRGWGSFAPHQYAILDNQYLKLLIETGFIGLAAYLIVLFTGGALAHRAARSGDPERHALGVALIGAIAGFAIASATFDVLSFAQAPYLLMFVLALAVVAADPSAIRARLAAAAPARARVSPPRTPRNTAPADRRHGLRRPLPERPPVPRRPDHLVSARRYSVPHWAMATLLATLVMTSLGFVTGQSPSAHTLASKRAQRSAPAQPGPSASYGRQLDQVIGKLNRVRSSVGAQLSKAHTARAAADAAHQLAVAHVAAASAVSALSAGSAATANSALATALHDTGDVYSSLARAAKASDKRRYDAARAALGPANQSVAAAFAQLARLGYRVS